MTVALESSQQRKADVETDFWLRTVCRGLRPGTPDSTVAAFERGDNTEVAYHLYRSLSHEKLLFDQGEIYRYRSNGVWVKVPNHFLQAVVTDLAGCPVLTEKGEKPMHISNSFAKDTIVLLEKIVYASSQNRQFVNAKPGLGFANGFLTIVNGVPKLTEHDAENLARFSYEFAYTPDAPHPLLDAFFESTFRGEDDAARKSLPLLLQEFLGACLFGQATKIEKILLLVGPGGNGKSQFLTIARSLFPPGSVSALPPQDWSSEYMVHDLAGKLGNFVDEIPAREISAGAVFKKIVSGQETHANRKFRDGILFNPIAGHIFNANDAPGTTDTSDGFFRRVLMVPFFFKPLPGQGVVDIGAKIAKAEKRAIVAWAIQGYQRLVANGMRYSEPAPVRRQSEAWRTEADSVRMFLFAVYDKHNEAERFSTNDLNRMYLDWCDRTKHLSMTLHKFCKRVRATGFMNEADSRDGRGFQWNHNEILSVRSIMGSAAPEWGTTDLPEAGTYAGPGFSAPRRSKTS